MTASNALGPFDNKTERRRRPMKDTTTWTFTATHAALLVEIARAHYRSGTGPTWSELQRAVMPDESRLPGGDWAVGIPLGELRRHGFVSLTNEPRSLVLTGRGRHRVKALLEAKAQSRKVA